MNLEEKVKELETRIEKIEAREKRRKIIGTIKVVIVIVLYGAILFAGYKIYTEFTEKIKPITDITDQSEDFDLKNIIGDYFK